MSICKGCGMDKPKAQMACNVYCNDCIKIQNDTRILLNKIVKNKLK